MYQIVSGSQSRLRDILRGGKENTLSTHLFGGIAPYRLTQVLSWFQESIMPKTIVHLVGDEDLYGFVIPYPRVSYYCCCASSRVV